MPGRRLRNVLSLAAVFAIYSGSAAHAEFPDHPLRLVVGWPPGGNTDSTARIAAEGLSKILKQTVIVDNKPGAAGMLGYDIVVKSPPDGYTMVLGATGALATAKALDIELRFDPVKDFVSAGPIASAPLLLAVRPNLEVKNLAEFIAYAKARPGKLTMATSGTGTAAHLAGELFQTMTGIKFLHVPYKGSSQAIADLLGGQVDLTFDQPASTLSQIEAGKLHALAIATKVRSSLLPNLPTFEEAGLPGFEASTTSALMFPAATPAAVILKINAAMREVLRLPETKAKFASLGNDVVEGAPADFDNLLQADIKKWTKVVKDANVKLP
jgi:tripartite-type tricarboxylate transporter receptor subunit TctC